MRKQSNRRSLLLGVAHPTTPLHLTGSLCRALAVHSTRGVQPACWHRADRWCVLPSGWMGKGRRRDVICHFSRYSGLQHCAQAAKVESYVKAGGEESLCDPVRPSSLPDHFHGHRCRSKITLHVALLGSRRLCYSLGSRRLTSRVWHT